MARTQRVDLLIVGGGVAAARCARTLRRGGWPGSILIVGDEEALPYNRPPLSKELLRDDLPLELLSAEPASWYERRAVEVRTGVGVTRLSVEDRAALLADGSQVTWDRCLLATGAAPLRPPVAGAGSARLLRTIDDAVRLRQAAAPGSGLVVIGGGFIGVEVAGALSTNGVVATVVERSALLWGGSLGATLSAWAVARLGKAGAGVRLRADVAAVEDSGVVLVDGSRIEAQTVLSATGVAPRTELAAAAGIPLDDGIAVDGGGRTGVESVWAAGDVASAAGLRVEHWHAARESGERVARSILGEPPPPPRPPWVFTEVVGVPVDAVGAPWPSFDDEMVLGDASRGRFGVALLERGELRRVVSVGGWTDAAQLRVVVAERPSLAALRRLTTND